MSDQQLKDEKKLCDENDLETALSMTIVHCGSNPRPRRLRGSRMASKWAEHFLKINADPVTDPKDAARGYFEIDAAALDSAREEVAREIAQWVESENQSVLHSRAYGRKVLADQIRAHFTSERVLEKLEESNGS